MRDFVRALIDEQTGCQAQLARAFGNQEAAAKRWSRLLHNERLEPRHLADAVLLQALVQLPAHGPVRLAIDWTIDETQPLLVVSRIMGRRAVPIYWRADDAIMLKGRMQRDERAVIRRAIMRILHKVGRRRGRVVAARGFAAIAWFTGLSEWGVAFVIRVQRSTQVQIDGTGQRLSTRRVRGNTRRHALGCLLYCAQSPQALGVTMSRKRDTQGKGGCWYLGANRPYPVAQKETISSRLWVGGAGTITQLCAYRVSRRRLSSAY
jgi:hypothetical protein